MPYASLSTACLSGGTILPVLVEVDIQPGLPWFSIIGLPDKGLEEARQRVRSAIKNSGYKFPMGKVTVNLSPAHIRKQGASFDLPIALGILTATKLVANPDPAVWVVGELTLDGKVKSVPHLAGILIEASWLGIKGCITPRQPEQKLIDECPSLMVSTLREATEALGNEFKSIPKEVRDVPESLLDNYFIDQIRGQEQAKRVLEIALAGNHNLLMVGPPGSGKTMLAKAAPQLLPRPSRDEYLQVTRIHSLAGVPSNGYTRPFRSPQHSLNRAALIGTPAGKIGELTAAHKGILFLDELAEMKHEVREALRQPMQDKEIRLSHHGVEYVQPADCLIIAAQNACPCGLLGVEGESCRCTSRDLARYRKVLSEPLLERFELFCEVSRSRVLTELPFLKGKIMVLRIKKARELIATGIMKISEEASVFLGRAAEKLRLSERVKENLKKVSWTVACLNGKKEVGLTHIQEALQYRRQN